MTNKIFAAGLGVYSSQVIQYGKVFIEHEENHVPVDNFLKILSVFCDYNGGNVVLNLGNVDLKQLKNELQNAKHSGAVETIEHLIEPLTDKSNAFICIMETNQPPENKEESYLILDLFSKGICNSLNDEHRLPLTKVFAGLATVPMSLAGIPQDVGECYDKFPSWLLFNDIGSNRFAPTSFVREGAELGNGNTLMMGVAVNFGAKIGNGNLIDGHSSIGSCVQIGNDNKIGSYVSMEGVLSPMNKQPVIVGNNNFFGSNSRIGTGIIVGDKCFWGSGVDISLGKPLRDFRQNSETFGQYVKAGDSNGIQSKDSLMITINSSVRQYHEMTIYPGEYLLHDNSEENQKRFENNDDLTSNN